VYRSTMISGGGVRNEVALKVLHVGLDPRSQAIQRLADEAKLLGLLSHPSILRIHDLVLLEGRITLVTEYVAGADLDECTTQFRDPMPPRAVLMAIAHVAAALHTAFHTVGPDGEPLHLLHRDIKPSNIRVGQHGEVKLLDFGIAKAAGERIAKTQTNALIGSFAYMSPERLDRDQDDGPSSDVFSLGVTLAEALTGKRLFDGSIKEIYRISMDEERLDEHVSAYLSGVQLGDDVRALLEAMLAYAPEARPALEHLSERLEDLADATEGPTLSRWCRKHAWEDGALVDGVLSGRSISESRLSAEVLGRTVNPPPPQADSGSLSDRTFQYEVGADTAAGGGLPDSVPPAPAFTATDEVEKAPPAAPAVALLPEDSRVVGTAGRVAGAGLALVVLLGLAVVGVVGGGVATLGGVALLGSSEGEAPAEDVPTPAEPVPEDPVPEAPVEVPVPLPDPRGPDGPDGPPDDGVVEVDPEPVEDGVDPASVDRCGEPFALEPLALAGRLGDAASCIEGLLGDARMAQTNRDRLGRILIVDTQVRCSDGSGCGDYERVQRTFFEEVTRSDAEMVYAFSGHLAAGATTDAQRDEAVVWSNRALELKSAWKGPTYLERVDTLLQRIARLSYDTFATNNESGKARVQARNAAVAWMNQRIQTGGDHGPALALCASVEGSEEACQDRGHDVGAQFAITFVSRPMGAMVFIDGVQQGNAPLSVQLKAGPHEVRMDSDAGSSTQRIEVDLEQPTRWSWSAGDDAWTSTL